MYGAVQKLPTYLQGAFSFIYPVVEIFVENIAFGHQLQVPQLVGAAAIILVAMHMTFCWRFVRTIKAASCPS